MRFVSQLVENYGNIVVFIILSCGLFSFPISDELLVLLLGYFTKNDALHYYPTLFVIFSGSVIGMLVNYLIGKKIGRPFLNLFGKWFKRSLKTSYKAEKWIQKYGFSAIIISYFVPGMRHITGYFCGMAHMALKSYVIYVVLSAFLWSWLFLTLSQFFKFNSEVIKMDTKITLTPVLSTQIDTFKKDLQDAFLKGLIDAFSEAENPIDMGPIPSDKDFDESIHSPESASYYFKLGDTVVGGVVLQTNKQAQKNEVDFFYIKADVHSKGLGTKAWFALEENFPQTKSWELHTPYFEKRNIHFYVNKCGFKIVEIYMMEDLDDPTEAGYEFLRFEKIINTKDC